MSTPEGGLPSATPDVSSQSVATSGSQPADSSPAPATADSSLADVQPQSVQGEPDPLAGLPTEEEIQEAIKQGTPFAKGLAQIKGAYDPLKTQFDELSGKHKIFENVADRFQTPEEVQETVDFRERFLGWKRDDSGQLEPATEPAAQFLVEKYPDHARYLWADMSEMQVPNPNTGQLMPLMDIALEGIAADPTERQKALRILGGVEPSQVAPQWQATAEELESVKPELQDIYKKLPYEEREELRANSPEFINRHLEREKFQQELIAQNQQAQERESRQLQAREQYQREQAKQAGNTRVEQGFRQVFTEFKQSIVERSKFVAPLDPQSQEAQQMPPEQVQQFNQLAERVNTGMGSMIALVTAAMSVPDTQWLALDFFKAIGLPEKTIQDFDGARKEFANNSREFGELEFLKQPGGQLQSNATRASKSMKGYGNLIAAPLFELVGKLFEMKASGYNSTLNGSPQVRPSITGSAFDPTREASGQPPASFRTKQEIDALYG
jgi:hypothetical protein